MILDNFGKTNLVVEQFSFLHQCSSFLHHRPEVPLTIAVAARVQSQGQIVLRGFVSIGVFSPKMENN